METSLVRIEDHRGNNQAQQHGADQCGQRAGRFPAEAYNMDSGHSVANAVSEGTDEEYLLCRENGQGGPLVATEREVTDDQRYGPVDHDAQDAPTGPGDGAWPGLRKSQSFTGIFGDAGCVRSTEPGAYVFAINHPISNCSNVAGVPACTCTALWNPLAVFSQRTWWT